LGGSELCHATHPSGQSARFARESNGSEQRKWQAWAYLLTDFGSFTANKLNQLSFCYLDQLTLTAASAKAVNPKSQNAAAVKIGHRR